MSSSETPPGGRTASSLLVGTLFADRFRVLRLASEGANTAIFDAGDEQTGRTVTLKLVQPSLALSPSFRERFDETMRSVASLSHPNIAAVYDWGIARVGDTSTAYVVIEHLTGGSLRDMFDRNRQLSPSQALAVGLDACRGLDHAHRRGFVHTELTPSKLVFGDDRRLRIIDFGLARLLGEPAWEQPDSVSTHVAGYASPEQALQRPIDGTTDVYALCLSLHEAVTGKLPFASDSTVATLAARVGRLMPVSADLGPLASVFERAGRPAADERSTAAEFGKALVQAASKLPRPEPLPLLSTGLFDTPVEQLRSPDDPTGGVARPGAPGSPAAPVLVVPVDEPDGPGRDAPSDVTSDDASGAEVPAPPDIVEAAPDAELPSADPTDDLVILPLDSGIATASGSHPIGGPGHAADHQSDHHSDHQSDHQSDHESERHELAAAGVATAAAPADELPMAPVTQVMPAYTDAAPRRRRRFPWKILVSVLVLAALALLGVLATRLFETPTYLVPDLVEMPEAEARNLVATNGWQITVDRERSDVVPIVGRVVRTVPQAGVELAEGEPFLLVASDGPTLRELPDSTGAPLADAQPRLLERGLDVDVVEEFDEVVPEGTVIRWSVPGDPTVAAGSMVEPTTLVELVVSRGPAPREVPNLVGRGVGEARAEIEALQLALGEDPAVFSDEVSLGTVIAQDVEPGTEVERGAEVRVVVSKGPDLVVVPDITAVATYEDAAALLRQAGFEPRLVFGDAQGAIRECTIDGAEFDVGTTFRRGTAVECEAL